MTNHTATIKPATAPYRVSFAGEVLFETDRVLELEEHFGDRTFPAVPYFAPPIDPDLGLEATAAESTCPLKGAARYFAFRGVADAVWSYPKPNPGVAAIAEHLGFDTTKGFRVERLG